MSDLAKRLQNQATELHLWGFKYGMIELSREELTAILAALEEVQGDLGKADVWHEGSQSFYHARLLRKLTPKEALSLPPEIEGEDEARRAGR